MNNNMRVVNDNAIDRAVNLVASSEASSSMSVGKLLQDLKSNVWRGKTAIESLSATWSVAELIAMVALPFCNFSQTATMRVRLTNEPQATNLVPASEDFSNACWQGYWTIPTRTTGIASPDGGTNATRLASTDTAGSTNNSESGLSCYASGATSGRITASIWARSTSGSLNVYFGVDDNNQSIYTLTTTWQRLTYTSANSLTITSGTSKILNIHEATVSNPAWEVFGAQSEVGIKASSYYKTSGSPATRPLGYIDSWQSYDIDSTPTICCPEAPVRVRGWTTAQSASAYAYGGGGFARVWLTTPTLAVGMRVDIMDLNNLQGYVEAARLVAANYWSTSYNPSKITMTSVDTTVISRTDAGDQWADAGKVYDKLQVQMTSMPEADRANFIGMVRMSRLYPLFIACLPNSTWDRPAMLYGRRTSDSDVELQAAMVFNASLQLESI